MSSRRYVWVLVVSAVAALALNVLTHMYDNKYSYPGEQAEFGILDMTEGGLAGSGYIFLTEGWEYYGGRLLGPADFADNSLIPDGYLYIGQSAGLDLGGESGAFGTGTYRIRILAKAGGERYRLEIPEIFSACKVYVNGELLLQQGNPEVGEYVPDIASESVDFALLPVTEIIIAASNYSHYYGGLIYPPAFGLSDAVERLIMWRMLIKGIQCFFALVVALSYAAIYLWGGKDRLSLMFTLLCACYLIYNFHMFMHVGMSPALLSSTLWYRIEDAAFYGMLLCVCLMQTMLSRGHDTAARVVNAAGAIIVIMVLVMPVSLYGSSAAMTAYGLVLDGYRLCVFAYVAVSSFCSRTDKFSLALLAGTVIFAVSVTADAVHLRYEPVVFGWGSEIAGCVLLIILLAAMVSRSIGIMRSNRMLQDEMECSRRRLSDRMHDMKGPVAAISGYVELLESGVAREVGKEESYVRKISAKAKELEERINSMRDYDAKTGSLVRTDGAALLKAAAKRFEAEARQAEVKILVDAEDVTICCNLEEMSAALDNLIANSLRFTPAGGTICLSLGRGPEGKACLSVSDTGAGISAENICRVFDRGFTTSDGHWGAGLSIVKAAAEGCGGTVSVESGDFGTTFTIVLPS